MKFVQYGSDNGRIVVYFHGAPGAPEECSIFDQSAKVNGLTFICLDRFSINSSITGELYYKQLAGEISELAKGSPVDFVGFSIGAFIAIQTNRYMGNQVRSMHLVSAAAPLNVGDFLEAMAGKQVFRLAKAFPSLFLLLTYWQSLVAWIYPKALFHLLFANAAAGDKALVNDRVFQSSITGVLRECFSGNVQGYVRDVVAYVTPWTPEVQVSTYIWHGAEDNWSPVQMAHYLKSAITAGTSIEIYDGLSHYSTLYRAAPEICHQIRNRVSFMGD